MASESERSRAQPETQRPHEETDEIQIDSQQLFQGRRVVVIVHNGERYRLLETRNGKLILQK